MQEPELSNSKVWEEILSNCVTSGGVFDIIGIHLNNNLDFQYGMDNL